MLTWNGGIRPGARGTGFMVHCLQNRIHDDAMVVVIATKDKAGKLQPVTKNEQFVQELPNYLFETASIPPLDQTSCRLVYSFMFPMVSLRMVLLLISCSRPIPSTSSYRYRSSSCSDISNSSSIPALHCHWYHRRALEFLRVRLSRPLRCH